MADIRTWLLGLTAGLGLASTVAAQPVQGLYVAGAASLDIKQIEPLAAVPALGIGTSQRLRFDADGFGSQGSVGYGMGHGFRVELEGFAREAPIRVFATTAPATGSGTQQDYGLMANALYDVDLQPFGISFVTPYIGVGVGYQWSHLNGLVTVRNNGAVSHIGGTDGSFAYQGIIGAALPITPVPGLTATLDYRFMGVSGDTTVDGTVYGGRIRLLSPISFTQNMTHSIMLGLRYTFSGL